jgi:hypothetical protein
MRNKPAITDHTEEADYLHQLASREGGNITPEEADQVLQRVRVVVLGDDDPRMRNGLYRVIAQGRKDVVRVSGAEVGRTGKLPDANEGKGTSVVVCNNGREADAVAELISRQGTEGSVFLLDHDMPEGPYGLDIFKARNSGMPPRTTRVLYSGTIPEDHPDYLKQGILDAAITKGASAAEVRARVARAFLERNSKSPK